MQVTIKFVDVNDSDLLMLVEQLNQYFLVEFGQAAQQYESYHKLAQMSCAIVAYVDDKPVGCGCWKPYDTVTAEIKRMFVLLDYRREGVATQIINALEKHAADSGCHKAVLEMGSSMLTAIRFYGRVGYRLIPNFGTFADDELCVCMAKEIFDGTMG